MVQQAIGDRLRRSHECSDYYPPSRPILTYRLGVALRAHSSVVELRASNKKVEGECLMENNTQDELKAHLMATNEEFRTSATQHAQYHKQLEELEAKAHLTEAEEVEVHRLKKQ